MTIRRRTSQDDLFASSQEDGTLTVSELTANVRVLLEQNFRMVRVTGEVSGMNLAASGHAYFTLKDERAAMPAVMFRSAVSRLGSQIPGDRTEVECLGRLTLYEPRGRTQLVVEWMVPRQIGALGLRFLELKARLEAEGLFAPERKRPIPFLPGRIGIVTSSSGAAIRDILHVLERRFRSIPVLLAPVRVQGEGAAGEIARALESLAAGSRVDVIIVGRGGGSVEDLWAFNEEEVVRAIAACPVPVISAVGHEVDLVLADLAADVRAPTPSAAAELVVPQRLELIEKLDGRVLSLKRALALKTAGHRNRLAGVARRIRDPRLVLAAHRMRLDDASRGMNQVVSGSLKEARRRMEEARVGLASRDPRPAARLARARLDDAVDRLHRSVAALLGARRERLHNRGKVLDGLNPLAVLGRGYSLVSLDDGTILRDAARVSPGDPLHVRLHRGRILGRVSRVAQGEDEPD